MSTPKRASETSNIDRLAPRASREERRQRQVVLLTGVTITIVLLALIGGVVYDRAWLPSRPVAQVGNTLLTRGDYTAVRRDEIAGNISQSLFLSTFGAQFAQQFLGQIGQLETDARQIDAAPIAQTAVDQWVDEQLIVQGAAALGVIIDDATVDQRMVNDYGGAFAPAGSLPAPTDVPLLPTSAPTQTPGGATATPQPTFTTIPTLPPTATPVAAEVSARAPQIIDEVYDRYVDQIFEIDGSLTPRLTRDDMRAGLLTQFRRAALTEAVRAKLVPDAGFNPATDPSAIETRQIVLKVTLPLTPTTEQTEAAFAARRAEIDALVADARGGADFATLASERSEDFGTREQGGTVESFNKTGATRGGTQIDPAYLAATLALKEGEVSAPFRTPFGWHIIKVEKITVDTREAQLEQARTDAFTKWLDEQRTAASIQRFPTPVPTEVPVATAEPGPLPTVQLVVDPSPTVPPTPTTAGAVVPAAPTPTTTPVP